MLVRNGKKARWLKIVVLVLGNQDPAAELLTLVALF